ncbi:MAG: ADP-ribosylglycohydrolase family protein, partial [Deltaproteobacteria bacterium]|nr:ADP-ribosylglycohydrolase family protein [Deltaproteobacteria bacterium]
ALELARASALPTHGHPEGIRGAEAVGGAVFLARTTRDKASVLGFVRDRMGYDLVADRGLMEDPKWFATCQVTVPAAFVAVERGEDFESTLREAVGLGGDTDTVAAMAGGVAEALYGGVPKGILAELLPRLDPWLSSITRAFVERHALPAGYYRDLDWPALTER